MPYFALIIMFYLIKIACYHTTHELTKRRSEKGERNKKKIPPKFLRLLSDQAMGGEKSDAYGEGSAETDRTEKDM